MFKAIAIDRNNTEKEQSNGRITFSLMSFFKAEKSTFNYMVSLDMFKQICVGYFSRDCDL
jgi:hypothetical protein